MAAVIGAVVALVSAACGDDGGSSDSGSGAFRIAVPADETGSESFFQDLWVPGLRAAANEINENGGILGRDVELSFLDTQSNPQRATQVLSDALADGDYDAVIAGAGGSISLPVVEVVAREEILGVFSGSYTANPDEYPTQFDVKFTTAEQATATACLVSTFDPTTVAIMATNDPFGEESVELWKSKFDELGIEVVVEESFAPDQLDFIPQLQRIQNADPDVLLVSAFGEPFRGIVDGMNEIGYNDVQVVGDATLSSTPPSTYLESIDQLPEGAVALSWEVSARQGDQLSESQQDAVDRLDEYVDEYTSALYVYLFDYDALHLVKWAAEKADSTDTADMVEALQSLADDPEDTGAVIQPSPPYSPTNHDYANGMYFSVDLAAPFIDGTYLAVDEVPSC